MANSYRVKIATSGAVTYINKDYISVFYSFGSRLITHYSCALHTKQKCYALHYVKKKIPRSPYVPRDVVLHDKKYKLPVFRML